MNDDQRRRRRPNPESSTRRSNAGGPGGFTPWLITILAALAVIAGGWYLGQGLAHVLGTRSGTQTAQTQPSSIPVVTPLPSPTATEVEATPAPSPAASPTAKPTPVPRTALQVSPQPSPTVAATPAPSPTPQPPTPTIAPTAAPTVEPTVAATKSPRIAHPTHAPLMTMAPVAASAGAAAEQTVRAYIDALRRGDPGAAGAYLGNGSPDEGFIDPQTRITSLTSVANADGSYKVEVDMQTSHGEYYETFQVASSSDGNRILDKTAIKP